MWGSGPEHMGGGGYTETKTTVGCQGDNKASVKGGWSLGKKGDVIWGKCKKKQQKEWARPGGTRNV